MCNTWYLELKVKGVTNCLHCVCLHQDIRVKVTELKSFTERSPEHHGSPSTQKWQEQNLKGNFL